MTDQNKNVVWTGSFDPFENVLSAGGSITNNLRFPGQYFDQESGLNYNGNRYYDPSVGRYTRPDPVGLTGGMNRYGYVQNDPVNFIDPRGLQAGFGYYDPGMASAAALGQVGYYGQSQPVPTDWTGVALVGGSVALVPAVALGGPYVAAAAATLVLSNPITTAYILNSATDFISNYYVTGPPSPNIWGYLGVGLSIYNDPESYGLSNPNPHSSSGCK
jgi:RHS repeat-associated protein